MSKETFFLPRNAFPADVSTLVRRCDKGVIVVDFAVTLFAADERLIVGFWIDRFDHHVLLESQQLIPDKFKSETAVSAIWPRSP